MAAGWWAMATGVRVGALLGAATVDAGDNIARLKSLCTVQGSRLGRVDLDRRTWYLRETKNQRDHLIHLNEFAVEQRRVLRHLRVGRQGPSLEPWLFAGTCDGTVNDQADLHPSERGHSGDGAPHVPPGPLQTQPAPRSLSLLSLIALKASELSMGTLTIRNLEDRLKSRLRLRAAARNRSMEEEARQILRAALQEPVVPTQDLASRIRARFSALGDVNLAVEPREPVRSSPDLLAPSETSRTTSRTARAGHR
jgi:antitoxin FitA